MLSTDCSLNFLESAGIYQTDALVVSSDHPMTRSTDHPIAHTTNKLDQQLVLLWMTLLHRGQGLSAKC